MVRGSNLIGLNTQNQPSISHLEKAKQLANIFLTAPYCSEKFEKIDKCTSADDKSQ